MLSTDIEQYQLYDKQSGQKFIPELTSLLNEFSKSNDKLAANYKDINFDNFLNYSIIVCENNICNLLLKIAKAKKLTTILDVSNIHISEKFKIIQNIRGSKITFPEKIILNRGLNEYHLADKITILSNNVLRSFKIKSANR